MSIKDHMLSGATGAAYGGVVGAAGGTVGVAAGVTAGVVAAMAIPCLQDKAPNVKFKLGSFFVTAAAGFGLACNACSPTLSRLADEVLSPREEVPATPPPAMSYNLPFNFPSR